MKTRRPALPRTRERCAEEYALRTGRLASDDARLGWALAVRAHLHAQALRAFANVGRARLLTVDADWPGWVEEGLVVLRPAFEAYRVIDPCWGLLVDRPSIARDLGLLDGGPLPSDLAGDARVSGAVSKAKRELDVSRGARARDEEWRAFFSGVAMRRPAVTPPELHLLAISVGLEPAPKQLDPGRRRWADRATRWELSCAERDRLAGVAAADGLLDGRGPTSITDLLAPFGVSDRSDSALGPNHR